MEINKALKKFSSYYLLFGLLVAGASFVVYLLFNKPGSVILWSTFSFNLLYNFLSGLLILNVASKKHASFMAALSGSIFMKMLFSLLLIFLLIKIYPNYKLEIVLSFFIFYLLFTLFEVFQLLYNLRPIFNRKER